MGLIIEISKSEVEKFPTLMAETAPLCQVAIDRADVMILVPLGGKLVDVLRILNEHDVLYTFANSEGDIL